MALIHLSRSSNRCRCSAWIPILLPQHHCSPQAASRSTLDKKLLYPNNEFSTKFQFYQTYLIHQIGSEAASLSSLWRWSIFSLLFMFFYHFFHFPLKFWFSRLFVVHAILVRFGKSYFKSIQWNHPSIIKIAEVLFSRRKSETNTENSTFSKTVRYSLSKSVIFTVLTRIGNPKMPYN